MKRPTSSDTCWHKQQLYAHKHVLLCQARALASLRGQADTE